MPLRGFSSFLSLWFGLGSIAHKLVTYAEWRKNLFRMSFRKYYQLHAFLYDHVWPAVRFSTIWLPADVIIGVGFNGWDLQAASKWTLWLQTNKVPAAQLNRILCVLHLSIKWKVNAINKGLVADNASMPSINAGGEPVVLRSQLISLKKKNKFWWLNLVKSVKSTVMFVQY